MCRGVAASAPRHSPDGTPDEQTVGSAKFACILYEYDARGRVAIESKDDARKRGVKSPDRAEAMMLAFAKPALGWTRLEYAPDMREPEDTSSPMAQLRNGLPRDFADRDEDVLTCGECVHFSPVEGLRGQCALHGLFVVTNSRWCEWYDAP